MKIKNVFLPLLAAAIFPAVFFTLVSSILDSSFAGWVVIIFPFVLLTTFLHTIILGMPLILLLRKLKLLNFTYTMLVGFIVGGIPIPLVVILTKLFHDEKMESWQYVLKGISSLGVLGIIGGIAFWFVFTYLEKSEKGIP